MSLNHKKKKSKSQPADCEPIHICLLKMKIPDSRSSSTSTRDKNPQSHLVICGKFVLKRDIRTCNYMRSTKDDPIFTFYMFAAAKVVCIIENVPHSGGLEKYSIDFSGFPWLPKNTRVYWHISADQSIPRLDFFPSS